MQLCEAENGKLRLVNTAAASGELPGTVTPFCCPQENVVGARLTRYHVKGANRHC